MHFRGSCRNEESPRIIVNIKIFLHVTIQIKPLYTKFFHHFSQLCYLTSCRRVRRVRKPSFIILSFCFNVKIKFRWIKMYLSAKNWVQSSGFLLQQQIILLTFQAYSLLQILVFHTVEIRRHVARFWQYKQGCWFADIWLKNPSILNLLLCFMLSNPKWM